MVKVSDYIASFIADLGVKHVFLLASGQIMHLVDSIGKHPRLKYVCPLHEQAAAMMAEAYSRTTDNFGVAVVTTGPGGTNAMTGLAGAWLDSTPCMFISGQFRLENIIGPDRIRQTVLQGTNPVEFVKPLAKYVAMITEPRMVRYHLEKSVYLAKSGRPGPVWLDIPLDIQGAVIDEADMVVFDPQEIGDSQCDEHLQTKVTECLRLLGSAQRPVILAGNGIRLAHAIEEFRDVIEKLGIPVLTSMNGIDLLEEVHPLFMGRPNYWGQRAANFIIQNADVLLSIGSGLHLEITGFNYKAFARAAKKIIVDIDQGELDKRFVRPDLPIRCDAKQFLLKLCRQGTNFENPHLAEWRNKCREWKQEYPPVLSEFWEEEEYVHPFVFVDVLSDEAATTDVIIPGNAGTHFTTCVQALRVKKGQRVFSEIGIGAMGYSLPASIAACLARDKKRVICVTGDGGIQLNIQELQTVLTHDLPIKIFVMNNGGYASIRSTQRNYFQGRYVASDKNSGLRLPNIIAVAKAYGFKTDRILNHSHLREKMRAALQEEGSVLCEVMLCPDPALKPRLGSRILSDGRMVSNPLEDLSPILEREEFMAHMFIPPWAEGEGAA